MYWWLAVGMFPYREYSSLPKLWSLIEKKLATKWKNQINRMENGLEKSKNVTKIVVD